MSKYKYTVEEVQNAVNDSFSIAQVLSKLGIVVGGGNYQVINRFIQKHNIDISHFTGQGHSKGKIIGPKVPVTDYLTYDKTGRITSHHLRIRLLNEGVFEKRCSICRNDKWLNNNIPLELDHINGDHADNRLENLRVICPNCHAQTKNYRAKNMKSRRGVEIGQPNGS